MTWKVKCYSPKGELLGAWKATQLPEVPSKNIRTRLKLHSNSIYLRSGYIAKCECYQNESLYSVSIFDHRGPANWAVRNTVEDRLVYIWGTNLVLN